MKILVLSDSHQTMRYMVEAVEKERPDHVIHLGDHTRDAEDLRRQFPMLPILMVRGNCDFDYDHREQALAVFGEIRILAVHGHRYGVKSSLLRYELAARENGVQVALFGHTHHAVCEYYNGLWLLNPGSCGYSSRPTYGMIEIQGSEVSCCIKSFDE